MKSIFKAGRESADETEVPWATSPVPEFASAVRGPAPAGALQRTYPHDFPETEDDVPGEELYRPTRGTASFRVRGALKSRLGRVVVGSVVFVGLASVAAVVYFAHRFLLHDERFVIPSSAHIETVGNLHLSRAQLLSVFGEDVERNIFRIPLAQRRADLESLPWVQHATVMRLLPDTLRISVVERTPVAFARQGTQLGLVDANGVLLDMQPSAAGDPQYSFPVLSGLVASDPLSTRTARMEIYRRFMKELDGSGEKISDTLSEVDVTSPEDVKALIPSGSTDVLVHFGDEDFLTRYRNFKEHLPEWKQQYPHLASADMRYDRQVVLEMASGTTVPVKEAVAAAAAAPVAKPVAAAVTKPAGTKPVVAKPVGKPAVKLVAAKAPAAKAKAAAKPANLPGTSAANARMFAALAAAHKAQMEHTGQGPK